MPLSEIKLTPYFDVTSFRPVVGAVSLGQATYTVEGGTPLSPHNCTVLALPWATIVHVQPLARPDRTSSCLIGQRTCGSKEAFCVHEDFFYNVLTVRDPEEVPGLESQLAAYSTPLQGSILLLDSKSEEVVLRITRLFDDVLRLGAANGYVQNREDCWILDAAGEPRAGFSPENKWHRSIIESLAFNQALSRGVKDLPSVWTNIASLARPSEGRLLLSSELYPQIIVSSAGSTKETAVLDMYLSYAPERTLRLAQIKPAFYCYLCKADIDTCLHPQMVACAQRFG